MFPRARVFSLLICCARAPIARTCFSYIYIIFISRMPPVARRSTYFIETIHFACAAIFIYCVRVYDDQLLLLFLRGFYVERRQSETQAINTLLARGLFSYKRVPRKRNAAPPPRSYVDNCAFNDTQPSTRPRYTSLIYL